MQTRYSSFFGVLRKREFLRDVSGQVRLFLCKFRELLKLISCNRSSRIPRNYMSAKLHGITTQNAIILIAKAVMIPNLKLMLVALLKFLEITVYKNKR
jgi:hypothetical protein